MNFNIRTSGAAVLAGALGFALQAGTALAAPKEVGIWYDDSGKGAVRIDVCGDKLCGRVHWLKEPLNAEGKPLRDRYNPNEGQRGRPICGLQVIGGLALMTDGTWDSGWIYDPKEGKSYSVTLTLSDANTMKVTGYLVMKMMGRTLTWTRAPDDLPQCANNAAAAPQAGPPKALAGPSRLSPIPVDDDAAPSVVKVQAADTAETAPPATKPATAKPSATKPAGDTSNGSAASAGKKATQPAGTGQAKAKAKSEKKTAAKSKTQEPEQLPWAPKKQAPAAGSAPATETSESFAAAPVTVKPERPAPLDDQARPGQ